MTDDELHDLMSAIDPTIDDPAPAVDSERFRSILERATTETSESGESPTPRRHGHRTLTAVAVAAVVAVLGAVGLVLVGNDEPAETTADHPATSTDPTQTVAPPAPHTVRDAVAATRAEPAMAVAILRPAGEPGDDPTVELKEVWHYGAPDRWEALLPTPTDQELSPGHPPAGVSARLFVGDRTWAAQDGRWVAENRPNARTPLPVTLLDGLAATDCFTTVADDVLAWSSSEAPCDMDGQGEFPDLPPGTSVMTVRTDSAGRLVWVSSSVIPDLDGVSGDSSVAETAAAAQFWYDDVPEVSTPPEE